MKHRAKLFLLFACIAVSVTVGLGVRSLFSPTRLQHRFERLVEPYGDRVRFSVKDIRLSLADGLLPQLALQAKDLSANSREAKIEIDRAQIKLGLWQLLSGKPGIANISIDNLDVRLQAKAKPGGEQSSIPAQTISSTPQQKARSPLWPKPPVINISSSLAGTREINVQKLSLWLAGGEQLEFSAIDLEQLAQNELRYEFNLQPGADLTLGEMVKELKVWGSVYSEKIEANFQGHWQEARIASSLDVQWIDGEPQVQLIADIKNAPLAQLARVLKRTDLIGDVEFSPRLSWLSCRAEYKGPVREWKSQALKLKNCGMNGDIGNVLAKEIVLTLNSEQKFLPFDVEIRNLALQPFLKAFGREGPSGILSGFGHFEGNLHLASAQWMLFQGQLRDAEFVFSKGKRKRHQKVKAIKGRVQLKEERVSGIIDSIELEGGEFKGTASFNVDEKFKQGVAQVQIESVGLNSDVQDLLVEGQFSPLAVVGRLIFEQGNTISWQGDIGLKEVITEGFRVEGIRMTTRWQGGFFEADTKVQKLAVHKDGLGGGYLKVLHNPEFDNEDWLEITNLRGHTQVRRGDLRWSDWFGDLADERELTSRGSWSAEKHLSAVMRVASGGQNKTFTVAGDWRSPQVNRSPANRSRVAEGILEPGGSERTNDRLDIKKVGEKMLKKDQKVLPEIGN